jgi:hypothetical protein
MRIVRGISVVLLLLAACGPKSTVAHKEPVLPEGEQNNEPADPDPGPDQAGEITMEQVKVEMQAVRDEIQFNCANTTVVTGVVKVYVTIKPDGTATAEITEGSGTPEVDQCVLDSISGSQFSTSERGQRFQYSFTFK